MKKYPTRPALFRICRIVEAIAAGNYPNARSLATSLEVSARCILRDVEYLRDMLGAPIEYDAVRRGYFYSRPGFSLPTAKLSEFDFAHYMGCAFRVMHGGRPRRVRLHFEGRAAEYVTARKWHPSQRIVRRRRDGCMLEMTVTNLAEVASWVMSFGGDCQVVAPAELRTAVEAGHRAGVRANGGRRLSATPAKS